MATRIATRPRLGWLRARLAISDGAWRLATGDLKAAVERWENEGGARDVPRLRNERGALVDQAHPLTPSGDHYGNA